MATVSIAAGDFRQSIRIERRKSVDDGMGNTVGDWSPILTGVRARIAPAAGTERLIAQGLQAVATWTIWLRSSSDTRTVTEADRIVDERTGTTFNIRSILNPDEQNKFLQVIAEKGGASG